MQCARGPSTHGHRMVTVEVAPRGSIVHMCRFEGLTNSQRSDSLFSERKLRLPEPLIRSCRAKDSSSAPFESLCASIDNNGLASRWNDRPTLTRGA